MAHYYSKYGELFDCDIRKARKENLYPSITTVLSLFKSEGLEIWKRQQAIEMALTSTKLNGETDKEFMKRILEESNKENKEYAETGTIIHSLIEQFFNYENCDPLEVSKKYLDIFSGFIEWRVSIKSLKALRVEKIYINEYNEYGGKIDLLCKIGEKLCLIDFKTQKFKKGEPVFYDEMGYQLSAQQYAIINDPDDEFFNKEIDCYNLFIATNEEDLGKFKMVKHENIEKSLEIFLKMLKLYYLVKY